MKNDLSRLVDLYSLSVAEDVLNKFHLAFRNEINNYSSLSSDDVIEIFNLVFNDFKDEISSHLKKL